MIRTTTLVLALMVCGCANTGNKKIPMTLHQADGKLAETAWWQKPVYAGTPRSKDPWAKYLPSENEPSVEEQIEAGAILVWPKTMPPAYKPETIELKIEKLEKLLKEKLEALEKLESKKASLKNAY